jgi:trk system potassium uptake protein TrkA
MHVIVVGCGRVGSELATELSGAGHDVVVVDRNARSFRRLPENFPGRTVVGSGFDRDVLEAAGVHHADAVAAVTSGDNSNILTARIARENFEVANVVARIYDPRRAVIYQRLGIPTVATVRWTTDQILRRLLPDTTHSEWSDPSGSLLVVERVLSSVWAGHPLSELDSDTRHRIVGLTRSGEARIPGVDTIAQDGDVVLVAVRKDAIDELDARLAGPTGAGHH